MLAAADLSLNVEKIDLRPSDLQLPKSLRAGIFGPSQSGKSHFIEQLLVHRDQLFQSTYARILLLSPNLSEDVGCLDVQAFKRHFSQIASPIPVLFLSYIPSTAELQEEAVEVGARGQKILVIADDFTTTIFDNGTIQDILIRLSSKRGIDLIFSAHSVANGSTLGS